MIKKRNISTFAIGLCLLALMLLSASPAKAFKTTDPNIMAAYNLCLKGKYNGSAKLVKQCFREIKRNFSSACFVTPADTKSGVFDWGASACSK